jgi:DNA-binding NarL/FixJ family response regulator
VTKLGVVVAEDDVFVREGVASLLIEAGFDVFAKVGDASSLAEVFSARVPDLVVLDIRMPPTNRWEGLDAARNLRRTHPDVGILLLSAHVEIETALELLDDGRRIGYLLKSRVARSSDLVDAARRINDGECVIDPVLVRELFNARRRPGPLSALTPREREVLTLMAEGRSNSGIATRLTVTEGAVEKYVSRVIGKLALPGTTDDHRRVLAVLTFLDSQ